MVEIKIPHSQEIINISTSGDCVVITLGKPKLSEGSGSYNAGGGSAMPQCYCCNCCPSKYQSGGRG